MLGHHVDGYSPDTRTVFEYHGCPFHGCPKCYTNRNARTPFDTQTMTEAYQATLDKAAALKRAGYRVVEAWHCEVQTELETNPAMKTFFDNIILAEPLNPRHTFFGGRTNAVRLWKRCRAGEQIGYVDVCSL